MMGLLPWLLLAAAASHPMTVDDLWAVKRVGAPVVSPDGSRVAYTVSTYDMDENRGNADIYLLPLAGGSPRRLTTNKASDSSPAWSPDGKLIAFVSKREGDQAGQIYVISTDGGEAERVTEMPLGASDPHFVPGPGRRLAFVSSVISGAESPEATKKAVDEREKSKVKARITEDRLYRYWDHFLEKGEVPHIFVVDLETRKVTDLLPGWTKMFPPSDGGGGDFDVSPDGSLIAFEANSTDPPYDQLNSDVYVVPTAGGEVRNLTASNLANDGGPIFSPDGKKIAYGLERKADAWPDYTRLAVLDLASGQSTALTEGWEYSPQGWSWTADSTGLVFAAERRARTALFTMVVGARTPKQLWQGGTVTGLALSPGGDLVINYSTLSRPPGLATLKVDGSGFRDLTHDNDELMAGIQLGEIREQTIKGALGEDVQMWVVLPPGYEAGKKYPLLHMLHGGPVGTTADSFHFRWNMQLFAAPGYVVAGLNFHGSSSFGQAYVESILGAHPDKPFTDVMKATDALIAQGLVDPQRMACAGGSYGGFLVNWIAGHTDRFKALVSHAGVYSLLGQFASDGTHGRNHSYGGFPFTNLANIERWSPDRYSAAMKTPMLIIHGERDYRVPVTQGLELYGTLKAKGVPARLVYFPDENHWVLKGQNSRLWYNEVHAFLAKYLK
jgi:dipeptidyl aminopeptidase/acylaminoacyl peptidase